MQITITTPALLFPAISLLFLAYSNRFHALAALLRTADQTHPPATRGIHGQSYHGPPFHNLDDGAREPDLRPRPGLRRGGAAGRRS